MEELNCDFSDLSEVVGGYRTCPEADTYTVYADGKPCTMDGCDEIPCSVAKSSL